MSDVPKRIQRKRTKGWKMPEYTVYVGRGSKWGNPYIVGKTIHECDGSGDHRTVTRTLACNMYEKMMIPYTHNTGSLEAFMLSEENLERIQTLRGKNLACWCKLNEKCHADFLLEIANIGNEDA